MSYLRLRRGLAAAALVAAGLGSAHATEAAKPDALVMRLFGKMPEKQKVSACFARVYDAKHLAQHPKQTVASMLLLVGVERDEESKSFTYSFSMGVKFRNRSARFESAGNCSHAEATAADAAAAGAVATDAPRPVAAARFGCSIDCDGGGFDFTLADDNKSVTVSLESDRGVSIWEPGNDDPEQRQALEAGADDKTFLLMRTNLADCVPLAADKQEAAALKRGN